MHPANNTILDNLKTKPKRYAPYLAITSRSFHDEDVVHRVRVCVLGMTRTTDRTLNKQMQSRRRFWQRLQFL